MDASTRSPIARVVSGGAPYRSAQGSVYAPGVSAETAGSQAVFLGRVTLLPGERTRAHVHERHESAFYLLSGDDVELWSGPQLEHCERAHAGDYLFIPAGIRHVAVNRSATEAAVFIGVRNEPTAQESLLMRPELDRQVP